MRVINKHKHKDVKSKIDFVGRELEKVGVSILTYTADGDARELKYMRQKLRLGFVPQNINSNGCFFRIS